MSYPGRRVIEFIDERVDVTIRPVRQSFARCGSCGFRHHAKSECGADETPERITTRRSAGTFPLTDEQKFLLFRGAAPSITFPAGKPCPASKGDVKRLSDSVSIEVTEVGRSSDAKFWVLAYTVRDNRPNLLRRVPQVHLPEDGAVGPPTLGDIEAARLDSSYTHSPRDAVPSAGEGLVSADTNLLVKRAKVKMAERRKAEDPEADAKALASTLNAELRELGVRAAKMGLDATEVLAPIAKQIEEAHAGLGELRDAA